MPIARAQANGNLAISINPALRNNAKSYANVKNTLLNITPKVLEFPAFATSPNSVCSSDGTTSSDGEFAEDINRYLLRKNTACDVYAARLVQKLNQTKKSLALLRYQIDDNARRVKQHEKQMRAIWAIQAQMSCAFDEQPAVFACPLSPTVQQ